MMFERDGEMIYQGLSLWANWIETGDVSNSAEEFIRQKKLPKPLSMEQQKLVIRIRELATKHLTGSKP